MRLAFTPPSTNGTSLYASSSHMMAECGLSRAGERASRQISTVLILPQPSFEAKSLIPFSLLLGNHISTQSASSAMDIQVMNRVNRLDFCGDCSIGSGFPFRPIRFSKDSKQKNREFEVQPQPIRSPQQMVDRDHERGGASPGPSTVSLVGDRGKRPAIVGPSHSEGGTTKYTLRTHRKTAGEASSAQSHIQNSTQTRTISISIHQQPPLEVRPGDRLPPIVVNIRRLGHQQGESLMGEEGSMWAQVSLMSADGQLAMALFAPDILAAEDMITPIFQEPSATPTEEKWSLSFRDLRIRHSGYFKIHIAVLRSSQREERDDEDPAIEPPRELMGVDTQVIRVHAFASSSARTGER